MSGKIAKTVGNNSQVVLRNRAAEFAPLVELEGTWCIRDADGDSQALRDAIHVLKQHGCIEHQGKNVINNKVHEDDPSQGSDILNQWRWNGPHKRYLQQVLDERTTMPECNHRVHIYNAREVDGFSCRKCVENGEYPEYSRETIEALL